MPILRVNKNGDFTILPNEIANRTDMSLKAKGLAWYLLSKPDDWSFSFASIVKYSGKDGKDAVKSAVNELIALGYLEISEQERSGRFSSGIWIVHETPIGTDRSGFSAAEKPQRKNRSGKPATTNTKETNTEELITSLFVPSSENPQDAKPKRFVKPTPDEVAAYAASIGKQVDAQRFCDYYESKGWMVGKNPMKDWKAAVRYWTSNSSSQPSADDYPQYSFRRRTEC